MAEVNQNTRVAIVSSSLPPLSSGGISSSHFNLYHLLRERYDVRVFTFQDPAAPEGEGGEILRGGLPRSVEKLISFASTAYLRGTGASGSVFQLGEVVAGALAGLKLLPALSLFAPDIVIVPDHGAVSAFWPSLGRARTIFVSHHNAMRFCQEPLLGEHSVKDASLARWFEQRAVAKAAAVTCPSEHMKEQFLATYRFSGPVEVVPNVVETAVIDSIGPADLCQRIGLADDAPVVYLPSAGSLYKGKQFVYEIVRRVAAGYAGEVGFYLSGSLDADLKGCLGHLPGNARVYAPGPLPYLENISCVKACTLCVSPTLLESFGMALLEAQCCGLPSVAFATGATGEVVEEGETGFLAGYLDVDALVARTLLLLQSNALREKMGEAARAGMRQRFSSDMVAEQYRLLFSRLI